MNLGENGRWEEVEEGGTGDMTFLGCEFPRVYVKSKPCCIASRKEKEDSEAENERELSC